MASQQKSDKTYADAVSPILMILKHKIPIFVIISFCEVYYLNFYHFN